VKLVLSRSFSQRRWLHAFKFIDFSLKLESKQAFYDIIAEMFSWRLRFYVKSSESDRMKREDLSASVRRGWERQTPLAMLGAELFQELC
jgi:hypothetical protein